MVVDDGSATAVVGQGDHQRAAVVVERKLGHELAERLIHRPSAGLIRPRHPPMLMPGAIRVGPVQDDQSAPLLRQCWSGARHDRLRSLA